MIKTGTHNDLTDIAGVTVGQSVDETARTGVTVMVAERAMTAAVDVRGGGPGTRETDALAPGGLVGQVDAIVLAGGSVYGLAAADGVCAGLGAAGRGFALMDTPGVPRSPIVPAAILYDLANGGDKAWGETPPYRALGLQALKAASDRPVELGRAGAGFGAMAGTDPGGTGSASAMTSDGYTVGALVCVNSFGSVRIPGSDAFWANPFEIGDEFGGVRPPHGHRFGAEDWGAAKLNPGARENTTIAIVATDAALTRDQARRLAVMAQDGLARAIRPVHTPFDGDVVFAVSTGDKVLADPEMVTLARLGALCADTLTRAVARAVFASAGR
ncbi:peptidase T4 [Marinicauda pacifica]|uniref:Peptidase S58 family protein n=1 Tax=Marinicauda pacifica TaxID=1133559 RepID=A0A4S2HEF7_9PROT|nr:P1 family peptidase [Marinicauda pacifica]TGY93992.1 peptidase S58 family protein [Marinicauda pacifica]GGE31969.1 peptidase T4 [Marinicauda pacifica]